LDQQNSYFITYIFTVWIAKGFCQYENIKNIMWINVKLYATHHSNLK
jgi:hypothetical protein